MDTARRILHVFGRLNRGGAEMRTLDILRRLDPRSEKLGFMVLSGLPGELDDEFRKLEAEVHFCRLNAMFPWRFRQLLAQGRWDVVHSHVQLASGLILRYAHRAGVAIRIAHFRSVSSGKPQHCLRRLQEQIMRRWLAKSATLILGNGESSLAHGWRADWRADCRCAVIHNGLDTAPFASPADQEGVRREFGWPLDCLMGIHVGRMDPAKNHMRLVEIIAGLTLREPSLRFLFVGRQTPGIFRSLQARIESLGLSHRIDFAGTRDDVPRLLKAANFMLFPSTREGLPGAVLEACAAGTPVIASDLPSTREIAERLPGIHCLPLAASDQQWAHAVRAVIAIRQPAERDEARRLVEQSVYAIDRCVQAHVLAWAGLGGAAIRQLDGESRYAGEEAAA